MNLEISTETRPYLGSLLPVTDIPRSLVLEQSAQWQQILSGFERGQYAPKMSLTHSVTSLCDRFPVAGRRILDAGCGTGLVGAEFIRCGADIFGIDILPFAVDQASKRFPTIVWDICSYRDHRLFDAALCSMVLMLVEDIGGAIRNLSSQIAARGYLFAAILNPLTERKNNSRGWSSSRLSVWKFWLNGRPVEINYFSRTLDEYFFHISQEFTIEFVSTISPTGELLRDPRDSIKNAVEECLWIVARKGSRNKDALVGDSQ